MIAVLRGVCAALFCCGIAIAAAAQQPPAQDGPAQGGKAPSASGQPQETTPSSPDAGSLSHQLSRSQGVLQPPPTGDKNTVTPPTTGAGRTPVIPPPGTPGGNPQVQPK